MADISLETLKNDPKVYAAALEFSKKDFSSENILFYYEEGEPKALYEKYISEKAAGGMQVNLPNEIAEPMHQMAKASDWKNPKWYKYLEVARKSIAYLWNRDPRLRFLKSSEYQKVMPGVVATKAASAALTAAKAAVGAVAAQPAAPKPAAPALPEAETVKADPKKAAKLLGITHSASIALLTKGMDASFKGEKSKALDLFKQLAEKEDMDITPEMIMKNLQKLAKNPTITKL